MNKATLACAAGGILLAAALFASVPGQAPDGRLNALLETARRSGPVPGLAGAIISPGGLEASGAAGVRKSGLDVPVTVDDEWHIGSDTKAMTAAMIGALVERGTLKWETTIADVFPDLVPALPASLRSVTLLHLLSHRAGLPANIAWDDIPRAGTTRDQRLEVMKRLSAVRPTGEPGAAYLYSNLGYVIAGAIAEKAAGASWEALMRKLLFEPLGMTGAGFGGVGTPGRVDQPWGHDGSGRPDADYGPEADNPPVIGPAGTVHLPLADWSKFVADQLRGARGEKALLKPETYRRLHTPPFGGDYALGWLSTDRPWAGGRALTHAGSNGRNYAVAWLAPAKGFAVLVVCNQGGPAAVKACDQAAGAMIVSKNSAPVPARNGGTSRR